MQRPPQSFSSRWHRQPGWVRKGLVPALLITLIAGVGYYFYAARPAGDATNAATGKAAPADAAAGPGKAGGGRFGGLDPNRVQPVTAVPARVADINVVQSALGTVAALKVATVKARVDGLLQDVLFREGQIVRAGEVASVERLPMNATRSLKRGSSSVHGTNSKL